MWKSNKSFFWICFGEADFNRANVQRWTLRGNKGLTFRWNVSAFDGRAWSECIYVRAVCCWGCLSLVRCLVDLWYRFHPSCKGQMKCLKVISCGCDGFFIRNPVRSFPILTSFCIIFSTKRASISSSISKSIVAAVANTMQSWCPIVKSLAQWSPRRRGRLSGTITRITTITFVFITRYEFFLGDFICVTGDFICLIGGSIITLKINELIKWFYLSFLTINWVDAWGMLLPFTALSLSTVTKYSMKYKAIKAPV